MELNTIEVVTKYKHLQIREIKDDGSYHRRVLMCNSPIADDEHEAVKDKAELEWTDDVKSAWTTFQEEQEVKE